MAGRMFDSNEPDRPRPRGKHATRKRAQIAQTRGLTKLHMRSTDHVDSSFDWMIRKRHRRYGGVVVSGLREAHPNMRELTAHGQRPDAIELFARKCHEHFAFRAHVHDVPDHGGAIRTDLSRLIFVKADRDLRLAPRSSIQQLPPRLGLPPRGSSIRRPLRSQTPAIRATHQSVDAKHGRSHFRSVAGSTCSDRALRDGSQRSGSDLSSGRSFQLEAPERRDGDAEESAVRGAVGE
jgi:hypothetical protein